MSDGDALDLLRRIEQYQGELAAAARANSAKSEFINRMSQELRKPLSAILGYAQLLKRESIVSAEKLGDGLAVIERSGEQILKLVDDLKEFARIDAAGSGLTADFGGGTPYVPSNDADASSNGSAASQAEIEGYSGAARTVLIADDDEDNRTMLGQLLVSLGFIVHGVGNGFDALHWVRNSHPNLIITDMAMPVIDGAEFVRSVRAGQEVHRTPIIGMSEDATERVRQQAMEAGCSVFLAKPLRLRDFLAEVGAQLDVKWKIRSPPPG
ncbi:MAG: response regulator [Gammaproteobacteria bacterium]